MKMMTRFMCIAMITIMAFSLVPVANAELPSVYIPKRVDKLVDTFIEDYQFPTLVTKGDNYGKMLLNEGVMRFWFSEKPDWASAIVSSKNGGCIELDVNWNGYAELELEDLVQQPGIFSWNNNELTYWDKFCNLRFRNDWAESKEEGAASFKKGDLVPRKYSGWLYGLFGNDGDYPYSAGKDYGDYSVTVNYHRDGSAYKVAVALKNVDLFETGIEGAVSTITFELVNIELDSYETLYKWFDLVINGEKRRVLARTNPNNKWVTTVWDENGDIDYILYMNQQYDLYDLANTDVWYVSSVSAVYPDGNEIVSVEADYKNDAKYNLSQYKVSYVVNETDVAQIFYKTSDEPFYGVYSKDGTITAVSGSGNNLNKWYRYNGYSENATVRKPVFDETTGDVIGYTLEKENKLNNNGKQVKTIKKGINSYPSPRVITK